VDSTIGKGKRARAGRERARGGHEDGEVTAGGYWRAIESHENCFDTEVAGVECGEEGQAEGG
jgi:hypothetical protein